MLWHHHVSVLMGLQVGNQKQGRYLSAHFWVMCLEGGGQLSALGEENQVVIYYPLPSRAICLFSTYRRAFVCCSGQVSYPNLLIEVEGEWSTPYHEGGHWSSSASSPELAVSTLLPSSQLCPTNVSPRFEATCYARVRPEFNGSRLDHKGYLITAHIC